MQLKGQQAEYLVILQQLSLALDKANFYQARAAQQLVEGKKGSNYQEVYTSDALQQERNSEHYGDDLVACSGRLFKSLGLIELTFPPDDALSQKIISVESILTQTEGIFPNETMVERVSRDMAIVDAQNAINDRQKQRIPYIQKALAPIADLLNYLHSHISSNLPSRYP